MFERVQSQEEIEQLAQLASTIWKEYYTGIISEEQIDYMVEKFQSPAAIKSQIEEQGYEYYLLKPDGEYVGYIGIKATAAESLFLSKFYISKEYRGRGYGSKVMEFLYKLCQERDIKKIWLTVNRYNENSIMVYERKGFYKLRTQISDIGNGFVMDDYVMEKEITG